MHSSIRICASLLVLIAFAAEMPFQVTAGELQWRIVDKSVKESKSATKKNASPLQIRQRRADAAVQPAVLEDGGRPQLVASRDGRTEIRSIVIHSDEFYGRMQLAQQPSIPGATNDSQFQNEQPGPLSPIPDELPPLESTQPENFELDMPARPEGETRQIDQDRRQPFERPPVDTRSEPLDTVPGTPLPQTVPTPNVGTMEAERKKSDEACTQGLSDLQAKTIDTLDLTIAVSGTEGSDYPFECSLDENNWHEGRCWGQTTYMWKASALCHKPLYFEDEQLERYGHSWPPCCQPLVSGAHFFTRLPVLPYCMGIEPPNECIYALGHYRPGSCAPYMCNPVPFTWRGALFQAGGVVGAAAVLP